MRPKIGIFTFLFFTSSLCGAAEKTGGCHPLESPWISLTSKQAHLSVKSQPSRIQTSEPFNLIVQVCLENKAYLGNLKFNADMPRHKHGMNYQPSVEKQDNGQYLIKGSLLHMPGLWRFSFTLDSLNQPIFYDYALP